MIYDMQQETYDILASVEGLKKVHPNYPQSWNDFPMAVYKTKRKAHFIDAHKREVQSRWDITVEVYASNETEDLSVITSQINKKFKAIGFVGVDDDANVADLTRKILNYSAIVDNDTHMVYQK